MILVRFAFGPSIEVNKVLVEHMTQRGSMTVLPGVVVTVFDTDSTIAQIDTDLRAIDVFYTLSEMNDETFKGNVPGLDEGPDQIGAPEMSLEDQLAAAVAEQDYEKAALLQKQISAQ